MMGLDDILARVGHRDHRALWEAGWEQSGSCAGDAAGDLLAAARLSETCRWLDMAAPIRDRLLRAAAAIDAEPALRRLAVHIDWTLGPENDAHFVRREWPALPERYGEVGRLFYGVALLAAMRRARERHAQRGVPESISRDTLQDFELQIQTYHQRRGCWGFGETFWLSGHLRGLIYRLGRLQFELDHLAQDFHLLRRRTAPLSTQVVAGEGMTFRADGLFADADGGMDPQDVWRACYQCGEEAVRGHVISRNGRASPEVVTLPADVWEAAANLNDPVLGVHIPAIGRMDADACRDSFRQAMAFFPAHFPEHPFRAFTCSSWLLDPQLGQHLPETSNIVCFQRAFHLLPWPAADDHQTLERVFPGRQHLPIDELPQDTSLQRIVIQHMRAGGRWRMSGGIIPREGVSE